MIYLIDKKGGPAYLQLYRQLRRDVIAGVYGWGDKLPSKRLVAEETGASVITVEHAYALLAEEGYVEPRQRSGYFVSFRPGDGFAAAVSAPLIPSPAPHPAPQQPQFPFSLFSKTLRAVLSEGGETVFQQSPGPGHPELRDALRRYLARSRGLQADSSQIIIGSGSEYLYRLIVELLGRQGRYAIEAPSYKKIEQVYRACGVELDLLPLSGDGIDSGALWESSARVLHVSPYRSFPSGVTASASKRYEYLRWAEGSERLIVEDDFESEFSLSGQAEGTLFSHSDRDNVIYMNTFSQTVSPSLRTGYMVLPRRLLPAFRLKLGAYACTVPTCVQLVLARLIDQGDFERHINRVRRQKRKAQTAKTEGA